MPDIGLIWDAFYATGDWARADAAPMGQAEDGFGGDLAAAVMVSLFTDRRASDDYVLTDGTANRRGCWTDTYDDEPIGSRLWQLERSKTTVGRDNTAVLLAARDYCLEALAWLKRDAIVSDVSVSTFWARKNALGIIVTVQRAAGPSSTIDLLLPLI